MGESILCLQVFKFREGSRDNKQNAPIEFKEKPVDCAYTMDETHFKVYSIHRTISSNMTHILHYMIK
jgi:hypothetical protein